MTTPVLSFFREPSICWILRAVSLGPLHGFAGARSRIEQISGGALLTSSKARFYLRALSPLPARDFLKANWASRTTTRKASKFYELTAAGRKRLK